MNNDSLPSEKIAANLGNPPAPPKLDYHKAPRRAPLDLARHLGEAVICLLGVAAGSAITCVGADGLWYALMEAPAMDRGEDLLGAGLIGGIGVLVLLFSLWWIWHVIGPPSRPGGGE